MSNYKLLLPVIFLFIFTLASFGQVPTIFAPGVISSPLHDSAPAFSPDGKTVYFSRSNPAHSTIMVSRLTHEKWSVPEVTSFSGEWNDMEPAMSPDGSFLIFVSNRPAQPGDQPLDGSYNGKTWPGLGGNLWRVDRKGADWGTPVHLPDHINSSASTYAPSIAADSTLYFMHPSSETGKFRIFRARMVHGSLQSPEPILSAPNATYSDVDPAVAADGSFMVFGSGRAPATSMDLFIAFRSGDSWGEPIHLGEINSSGSDAEPRLSPDQKTLYFSSERVTSFRFPQQRDVTKAALKETWNNGLYNIWSVDLSSWLRR
jgi:Tol biopolymer transport system component